MNGEVYAFIDSQNLNLGLRSQGWHLDYKKFRLFLRNKYSVTKAFMFIGMVTNNQALYTELQGAGFILIFKPTISYIQDGRAVVKGNVDAELVLHAAAIEYKNYEKAIIVSGDGDFACLIRYLVSKDKLAWMLAPNKHYSSLLAEFDAYVVRLDNAAKSFGYRQKIIRNKKTGTSGRSKP